VITRQECREIIFGVLTETQRTRLERDLELDFGLQVAGTGRFRGNAHFSRGALEAVFRHVPDVIPSVMELGHRPSIMQLCNRTDGLILVTGMTGSGKTTTLASLIRWISENRDAVIVTIEDPIEFYFPSNRSIIKQRELGTDTKSFHEALRHVLRQDPDVVMVGEMRDAETVRAALTAAETGHLVLATLHTNDAPQALDRIVDYFPGDEQEQVLGQLSNTLAGILAQRLIPSEDGLKRILATEFLTNNSAIGACIREHRFEQIVGLMEIGRKDGMHTFDDMLEELYLSCYISKEEAVAGARDPSRMEALRRKPPQKA
jgi:twitching motility protein PilT